jgi:Uma2 family endonuclease
MSIAEDNYRRISETDYLQGELVSDIKHEYIDGEVFAMSGAKANHNRIASNVQGEFRNHLKGKPCESFPSDMKVKINSKYFYPDVMVVCSGISGDATFTESPTLIVEVLSKSTRRMDETIKREAYLSIPTLEEYVLIEQDFVDVEVVRKKEGWRPSHYFMGDEVRFESLDLNLSVEEIYDRVDNEDVTEWLEKKAREELEAQSEEQA